MADYQSLLTRAVANLPSSSPAAARQAIYDRARKALVTQLRTLRPPLPESDITREENALEPGDRAGRGQVRRDGRRARRRNALQGAPVGSGTACR